jgi:cysteine desulfurase/selenocysteine lyase
LRSLAKVTLHDLGRAPCAIVSFSLRDYPIQDALADAAAAKIVIGASPPASTRLDSDARGLGYILRASPHYFNIEADVDCLLDFCATDRRRPPG